MTSQELAEQLALAFDELATINDYLSKISPSLLALRKALEEVSPQRFESAYERYFLALTPPQASIETDRTAVRLRRIADNLKNSI